MAGRAPRLAHTSDGYVWTATFAPLTARCLGYNGLRTGLRLAWRPTWPRGLRAPGEPDRGCMHTQELWTPHPPGGVGGAVSERGAPPAIAWGLQGPPHTVRGGGATWWRAGLAPVAHIQVRPGCSAALAACMTASTHRQHGISIASTQAPRLALRPLRAGDAAIPATARHIWHALRRGAPPCCRDFQQCYRAQLTCACSRGVTACEHTSVTWPLPA